MNGSSYKFQKSECMRTRGESNSKINYIEKKIRLLLRG